ncbi:hypothetical protein LINPERPRIM_LOCUS25518 [Linum perenne]
MLDCGSKQAVTRVIKLERCWFGATRVLLDRWTVDAGRSKYLASQNLAWVMVQGIPLHLRSVDLFQRLGEVCGGFLDYDDKLCPLNSVRLKVVVSSFLPTQIRVCYLEESFILKVVRESWEEDNSDFGVGELVAVRKLGEETVVPPIEDWKARLLKKKAKAFEIGESSRSGVVDNGGFASSQGTDGEANAGDRRSTFDGNRLLEDLGLDTSFEDEALPAGFLESNNGGEDLRVSDRTFSDLMGGGSKKLDQGEKRILGNYVGLRFREDVGICAVLKRSGAAQGQTLVQLMSVCWAPNLGLDGSFVNKMLDLGRTGGPLFQNCKASSWVVGANKVRISNSEDLCISPSSEKDPELVLDSEYGADSVEEEKIINSAIMISRALDLQFESGSGEATEAVTRTAKEVLGRRRRSRGRTWTERELNRLGPSAEVLMESRSRGKSAGMISPLPLCYDS